MARAGYQGKLLLADDDFSAAAVNKEQFVLVHEDARQSRSRNYSFERQRMSAAVDILIVSTARHVPLSVNLRWQLTVDRRNLSGLVVGRYFERIDPRHSSQSISWARADSHWLRDRHFQNSIAMHHERPFYANPGAPYHVYLAISAKRKETIAVADVTLEMGNWKDIEERIIRDNHLTVERGVVMVDQGVGFETVMDVGEAASRYLRVGSRVIVSKDVTIDPAVIKAYLNQIIVLENPHVYSPYALTVIASLLAIRNQLKGQVVEFDGVGVGIPALVALRLGARRVVGIDYDPDAIQEALLNFRWGNLYRGKYYSSRQWQDSRAVEGDRFILIAADLNDWFDAPQKTRQRVMGGLVP
ncbi:MAG: 50S ribosomal protein L11 methyltransferase, partial [Candidatus Omnitrophica bacterium]|nr:50S ribosomal protein L11 methyltransferase [Candidatus Omnitrophota bacterium]